MVDDLLNINIEFESDYINPWLSGSPWSGHRIFAYNLIKLIKPEVVVELGTHYGCSFFAFCQAIKDCGYETTISAIDTWEGDEQAGFYSEEVYNSVMQIENEYFNEINTRYLRMKFDEAISLFEDDSIDILHIDGLHTYNATSNDYNTWLRKVKKDGIVLFHDIAAYTGYGSSVFWSEVSKKYKHICFEHNWGLGVLFPKGDKLYNLINSRMTSSYLMLYSYKSKFDLEFLKSRELEKMALDRFNAIQKIEKMYDDLLIEKNELEKMALERYESIQNMNNTINNISNEKQSIEQIALERYEAIQKMESIIKEALKEKSSLEQIALERYEAIQKMEFIIKDTLKEKSSLEQIALERYEAIQKMESIIDATLEEKNSLEQIALERYEAIQKMESIIKEALKEKSSLEQIALERYEAIQKMEVIIKDAISEKEALKEMATERYLAITNMGKEISDLLDKIEDLSNSYNVINVEKNVLVKELSDSIQEINRLSRDYSDLNEEYEALKVEHNIVEEKYSKVKKVLFFLK